MASPKIEPFDFHQETFSRYIQRVKIHFQANEVPNARRKFVFMNALSRHHFTLLANLACPDEPDTKSFDELVEILSKHFEPKTSEISERYTFHSRIQEVYNH